jgi:hypothetical protein
MVSWREFMGLDAHAHALYGVWLSTHNGYWKAYNDLETLELEKARILSEFDPNTRQSLKLQKDFPLPTTLTVRLVVPRSGGPFADVPIQVFVGGVQATRVPGSPKDFQVQGSALPVAELGQLKIEVR